MMPMPFRLARASLRAVLRGRSRQIAWLLAGASTVALVGGLVAAVGSGYVYISLAEAGADQSTLADAGDITLPAVGALRRERARLRSALAQVTPKGRYIVIDRTLNKLYLRDADKELLAAICSAGSGAVLNEPGGQRQWLFATPSGRFEVLGKIVKPVWRKPDWAFIEAGEPIPKNPGDRFVYGELGEYALYFGNGYMIHGTLYERLLGRSVSHGCVRLGRDDLRALYAAAPLGTPIYVY